MNPGRRDDVLVSICLVDLPVDAHSLRALQGCVDRIAERFAYFEVVASFTEASEELAGRLLVSVTNLRLLKLPPGRSDYRRRVVVASEAIGDLVLLVDVEELDEIDPAALAEAALRTRKSVFGLRAKARVIDRVTGAAGRSSGFTVSGAYTRSSAWPRTDLNRALRREDCELALRFPPASLRLVHVVPVSRTARATVGRWSMKRRVLLVQMLMTNSAASVLGLVSLASVLAMVLAVLLAVYIVIAHFVVARLTPGWTTVTAAIAFFAFIVGLATFGMSAAFQKIIDLLRPEGVTEILEERNRTDLFAAVVNDLNVEMEVGSDGSDRHSERQ